MNAAAGDVLAWYREVPVISRVYLTLAFCTTALCFLDVVSPLSLYFNAKVAFLEGEPWRCITCFLFFGYFSLDFVFHMYFLVRYCSLLEEGDFRNKRADFLYFIILAAVVMLGLEPWLQLRFLGSALSFTMVYVWSRRNPHVAMGFLGLFPFAAPWLPWLLLGFSFLLGGDLRTDLLGIAIGHIYYFLRFVYPRVAEHRQWRTKKLLATPHVIYWICGTRPPAPQPGPGAVAPPGAAGGAPVQPNLGAAAPAAGAADDAPQLQQPPHEHAD